MKPSRKKLRAMLEAAGTRPVPAASPAFVANLEQRLLGGAMVALPLPSERRGSVRAQRTRALLMPVAAAIAAVIVTGALTGVFNGSTQDSTRRVELSAAKDTVVELPNGSEVRGEPGLRLPDGAVVRTGPNGSATFGNVNLGPGEVATVDNGQIVITPPATTPTLPITIPPLPVTLPPLPVTLPPVPGLPLG